MVKHSKDWYFAAASANDLWNEAGHLLPLTECELKVGAPYFSSRDLWYESFPNGWEENNFDANDSTYLCIQYGLEKAGLA